MLECGTCTLEVVSCGIRNTFMAELNDYRGGGGGGGGGAGLAGYGIVTSLRTFSLYGAWERGYLMPNLIPKSRIGVAWKRAISWL